MEGRPSGNACGHSLSGGSLLAIGSAREGDSWVDEGLEDETPEAEWAVALVRILVITWYFPPASTIAAVRLGRLAQHLLERGHDVRVVCPQEINPGDSYGPLANYISEDRVERTRWADVNAFPRGVAKLLRGLRKPDPDTTASEAGTPSDTQGQETARKPSLLRRLLSGLGSAYALVLNWPDGMIGWLPYCLAAGRRLAKGWKPDLIFASGPPFTVLLVGFGLSKLIGVPWVVEFRDRWSDDPYYPPPGWMTRFNS